VLAVSNPLKYTIVESFFKTDSDIPALKESLIEKPSNFEFDGVYTHQRYHTIHNPNPNSSYNLISKITQSIKESIKLDSNNVILLTGDPSTYYNDWILSSSIIEQIYETLLSTQPQNSAGNDQLKFGLQCMLENSFGDLLSIDSFGNFGKDEKFYVGSKADAMREFTKGLQNLKQLEQKWEVEDVVSIVNLVYIFQYKNTMVSIVKLASFDNLEVEWEGIHQLLTIGDITGDLAQNEVVKSSPLLYYLINMVSTGCHFEFVLCAHQTPSHYESTLRMLEEVNRLNLEVKAIRAGNSDIEYPTDSEINRMRSDSDNYEGNRFNVQNYERNASGQNGEEDYSQDDAPQMEYAKNKYLNGRSLQTKEKV
jgi:hypothetical protein